MNWNEIISKSGSRINRAIFFFFFSKDFEFVQQLKKDKSRIGEKKESLQNRFSFLTVSVVTVRNVKVVHVVGKLVV